MREKFYGWKLVLALGLVYGCNIAFTSFVAGVIGQPMVADLKISRSVFGLGTTTFQLAMGFAAPLIALALGRMGARFTMGLGSLCIAIAALILATFVSKGWHYVLVFGIGLGLAAAFSTLIPSQACVTAWFAKKRGLALAIVMAASGVGGFISAPLLRWVIASCDGNWRAGWYCVSAVALITGAVAYLFIRNRPADLGQAPDGETANETARAGSQQDAVAGVKKIHRSGVAWPVTHALKCRANWLIIFAATGFYVPVTSFITHGVLHLTDLGHSPATAAFAIATIVICSTLGKLAGGYLCDRIEPYRVWFVCQLMVAVGIGMAAGAHSETSIHVFAAMLGIGYGGGLVCWPAIVANYFGAKSLPSIMGVQSPINAVSGAMAPLLVGVAFDTMGSYTPAFIAISVFTLITAVLLLFAPPPPAPTMIQGRAGATPG